ncbi:hypothetical protein MMC30_008331 [Trapelia coarctata]|nr:hypothetical protein [Trapelia coarctata]
MKTFLFSFLVCISAILLYTASTSRPIITSLSSLTSLRFNSTPKISPSALYSSLSPSPALKMTPRTLASSFLARSQSEGAGATVRRSIGTPTLRNLSPFLMLDHFTIAPGAGFPDHPHRGQETITYLLSGAVDHEDFAGNAGTIHAGDLQFMTAGRGIMHAEMPNQGFADNVGMQLWVDLPKALKGVEPRYRDLRGSEIPVVEGEGWRVKVISGKGQGVDSVRDLAYTPVWIFDVEVRPGGKLEQEIPAGWNAFAYVWEGEVLVGEGEGMRSVERFHIGVFGREGDSVKMEVSGGAAQGARFILVAGLPLDQKVVQYGPFVVTSQEEVYQAMLDYQSHSGGFERAKGWESKIGKSMVH